MRAAIWDGQSLFVSDRVELRPVEAGEVRVRVLRSGICHSDVAMMTPDHRGSLVILGHEAAGEIAELGPGVEGWAVGDHVAVGTQTPCGECRECRRGEPHNCDINWGFTPGFPFALDGKPVASFANVSSFASEIVVKASQLFALHDLPLDQGALIGCAVSTGVCASRVLGRVRAGDNVAVFGVGGIGVNAIQGAARNGAHVIAVDANPAKEAAARQFGADAFVLANPAQDSATAAAMLAREHGPIDVVVECSGAVGAIETAMRCTKRGGRVVLIGMSRYGAEAALPLSSFVMGGEVIATMNGGAVPDRDYPELIAQAQNGRLNLADQISGIWPLDRINEAIAALKAGEVTRAMIDHER
ncbi:putative aryl-alcohol dehydrogenase [Sphingobium herbicidovorans NBRC 16415]|uniref:Aryl-alcohol dehydrogenase n=1 Tax=Sphingobium herbicidovorans (strain ATCC 700291 / DSM 11019 / CCUG 56400 / KCTC 2939 / LMG 18315 / NBRC 16415 / MH) TaxID=1219045 RepID=A0A086P602_SPHHM|nr:alcohol dehydrogenase catalytic domain-containing protein [Sphingobium herbicidovorans]KFG88820.1 putative aryl-alcohol dehydrogenase [Sphingobium herbicidovorans NBRC 16415]